MKDAYLAASSCHAYDPETGNIRRLPRPASDFSSHMAYVNHIVNISSCCDSDNGRYRTIYFNHKGRCVRLLSHRLALTILNGEVPNGEVDHINGNGFDNRAENLRIVSRRENARNLKVNKRNKTGVAGVRKDKGRDQYSVCINSVRVTRVHDFFEAVCIRKSLELKNNYHENHFQSWRKSPVFEVPFEAEGAIRAGKRPPKNRRAEDIDRVIRAMIG